MARFALTIATLQIALTVGAVWIVVVAEPPPGAGILIVDDFRVIGVRITSLSSQRFEMPGGQTRHTYWGETPDGLRAHVEIRSGCPRMEFRVRLAEERRLAERAREDDALYVVVEEDWGGDPAFIVRRSYHGPATGSLVAEVWHTEGGKIVVAQVSRVGVSNADLTEDLRVAERHARSLALIAISQAREHGLP